MADIAHRLTDEKLEEMEKWLSAIYSRAEKTGIPSTAAQEVTPDDRYNGLSKVIVGGDANLVAGNIKSGVSIFGVAGSYKGSGGSSGSTVHIQEVDGIEEIVENAYISSGETVGNEYFLSGDVIPCQGWNISKWYPCLKGDYIILNKSNMNSLKYSSISDYYFNHLSSVNTTSICKRHYNQ